jgi:cobalamin biosynthesis protein CbiG
MAVGKTGTENMANQIYIIAHTEKGTRLGEALTNRVNAILRAPQRFFTTPEDQRGYLEPVATEVHKLFRYAQILILIMDLETAVRILAPVLTGRKNDPVVLVIDETGKYVIDLLSGNKPGVKQLVMSLADSLAATAVMTANNIKRIIPALDEIARCHKMNIESSELIPKFNEALANGETIVIWDRWGLELTWPEQVRVETDNTLPFFDNEKLLAIIGYQNVPGVIPIKMQVIALRPCCLTVGVGCAKNVSKLKVVGAVRRYFREQNWSVKSIKQLVAVDKYANQSAVSEAGRDLGVSVVIMTVIDLLNQGAAFKLFSNSEAMEQGIAAENAAIIRSRQGKLIGVKRLIDQISIAVALNREDTI